DGVDQKCSQLPSPWHKEWENHGEYLDNKPDIAIFWQGFLDVNPSKEVRLLAPIPHQRTQSTSQTLNPWREMLRSLRGDPS
ncbi:MAG: hypothetical protein WBO24_07070, partial [Nitrospirales bacterium]